MLIEVPLEDAGDLERNVLGSGVGQVHGKHVLSGGLPWVQLGRALLLTELMAMLALGDSHMSLAFHIEYPHLEQALDLDQFRVGLAEIF